MENLPGKIILPLLSTILVGLITVTLDYFGIIWHNDLFLTKDHIRGLDVSHYQGRIDWSAVASTKEFHFVYIKATEGHDYIDDPFLKNWTEAKQSGFKVGAYHFFSMRSSGLEQAQYYSSVVPVEADSLPPALDIELPLTHDPVKVREQIEQMAGELEKTYGKKPILYVTYDTYNRYIKGYLKEYGLWIRDIIKKPDLDDREWLIWQYSNRGRVKGISTYVDKNEFNGSLDEFSKKLR